jgi:hypothetical protein
MSDGSKSDGKKFFLQTSVGRFRGFSKKRIDFLLPLKKLEVLVEE